nr:LysR family transcriptional regulator [Streptomyces sp. COG19]
MFTLSQLESFVAVAETLHYGRAAERLSMTQPPLSRRIQLLERELGVHLFDRSGRSVRLTAAGQAFLGDARRILGLTEQAALSVRRTLAGEIGTVALGFTASAAHSVLDGIVGAIHTELPGVGLVLRERVSGAQLEELRSGELDLGLVRPPVPGTGIAYRSLHRESLLLATPADHPLAAPDRAPHVRDLDGEPFVMYSPAEARYFYEVLVGVFRQVEIVPHYVHYLSQVHTILALVRAGLGLALVPRAGRDAQTGRRRAAPPGRCRGGAGRTRRGLEGGRRQPRPVRGPRPGHRPRRPQGALRRYGVRTAGPGTARAHRA